ncbi:NAD-dependent epimerase/dehydratase family protein [Chloroflexota bacterium]
MRAVVTGCAGFIGSNLARRLLRDGYAVTGIDCFTDYYPREIKQRNINDLVSNPAFTLLEKNILEMKDFPPADFVFHQAAQAGVRKSWGADFEIYTRNNIEATQKLLEFYKDKEIRKFVYASSSSVYGKVPLPMKEDSVLKPESPYGVTKLAGENLCQLYHVNFGLPAVSLRYFTVYGPGQRPDMAINMFVRAVSDGGEITVYGDGEQTRDFTYVSDIVDANLLAAGSGLAGQIFNIGGGSRITVNELVRKLEKATGKPARLKYIEQQKGDVRDTLADVSRAGKLLKWQPQVGIDEGLRQYVDWLGA